MCRHPARGRQQSAEGEDMRTDYVARPDAEYVGRNGCLQLRRIGCRKASCVRTEAGSAIERGCDATQARELDELPS
jgi:hypothetical protein